MLLRTPEDPVLRIDASAAERLLLTRQKPVQICRQLTGPKVHQVLGDTSPRDDLAGPFLLIQFESLRRIGKRVKICTRLSVSHAAHNCRRVDPPRQRRPHRHITPKVQPNTLLKPFA